MTQLGDDLDTACEPGCYGEDPCRLCRMRSRIADVQDQLNDARAALANAETAGDALRTALWEEIRWSARPGAKNVIAEWDQAKRRGWTTPA